MEASVNSCIFVFVKKTEALILLGLALPGSANEIV
jgi:hypothetical protein